MLSKGWKGSGMVLHFAAMSGGSMTDTGPSCPNGSCAPLSRHSVDLLQRRQSTLLGHTPDDAGRPLRKRNRPFSHGPSTCVFGHF
jgi:hypothetical protein